MEVIGHFKKKAWGQRRGTRRYEAWHDAGNLRFESMSCGYDSWYFWVDQMFKKQLTLLIKSQIIADQERFLLCLMPCFQSVACFIIMFSYVLQGRVQGRGNLKNEDMQSLHGIMFETIPKVQCFHNLTIWHFIYDIIFNTLCLFLSKPTFFACSEVHSGASPRWGLGQNLWGWCSGQMVCPGIVLTWHVEVLYLCTWAPLFFDPPTCYSDPPLFFWPPKTCFFDPPKTCFFDPPDTFFLTPLQLPSLTPQLSLWTPPTFFFDPPTFCFDPPDMFFWPPDILFWPPPDLLVWPPMPGDRR